MAGYSATPLARKLGIKANHRVVAVHPPVRYREMLVPLPEGVSFLGRPTRRADLIHLFVSRRADLEKAIARCRPVLSDSAALWISWPKKASGMATDVTEDVIRSVALPLGLVDIKVCAIDEVWSGLKLVVRRENRRTS